MIETEISTHNFIYNPGTFTFMKKKQLNKRYETIAEYRSDTQLNVFQSIAPVSKKYSRLFEYNVTTLRRTCIRLQTLIDSRYQYKLNCNNGNGQRSVQSY